jgi:hypothetical protein
VSWAVWWEDEAGPQAGSRWQTESYPALPPQERIRGGTTKVRTRFEPSTGTVDLQPTASVTHPVLPAWLKEEREKKRAPLPSLLR